MILTHGANSLVIGGVVRGTTVIAGETYNTTNFNGQTWLSENLNLIIPGIPVNPGGSPSSAAIFYPSEDYRTTYGVLYNHYAVEYLENNKTTLTPGWRVPTKDDFEDLFAFINGIDCSSKLLNDKSFGCGFDCLGFNILPGGDYENDFRYAGLNGYIHTLTSNGGYAYHIAATSNTLTLSNTYGNRNFGFSLRLVKDAT